MTYLATVRPSFFTDYVHTQRGLSPNTIASYRDTWRLLVKHLCATTGASADQLGLADLDRGTVTGFLEHITSQRANTAATRKRAPHRDPGPPRPHSARPSRTGRIHPADPRHPARQDDETRDQNLTREETVALLAAPDTTTGAGRRDQTMLALTITTGLQRRPPIARR